MSVEVPSAVRWSHLGAAQRIVRWVADWFPLTGLGLLCLPALAGMAYWFGLQRSDRVLLAAGLSGLALVALCVVLVSATAVWLRWRREAEADEALELVADCSSQTGYRLPRVHWLPLLRVEVTWARPVSASVDLVSARGGTFEEVTVAERGRADCLVRSFCVRDAFGLARIGFERRYGTRVTVLPSTGQTEALPCLDLFQAGDQWAHSRGGLQGDLIEMRAYAPGDPLKHVLWKTYARTGRLLVRAPERAVSPCRRLIVGFVAGAGDEASAGVARGMLESGALGSEFLFWADGNAEPAASVGQAVEQLVCSADARHDGGAVWESLWTLPEMQAVQGCVLFVPSRPGAWLERIGAGIAGRVESAMVVLGVDGTDGWRRPRRWERLVFRGVGCGTKEASDAAVVCQHLTAAGATVVVIDRRSGQVMESPGCAMGGIRLGENEGEVA